MLTRREPPVTLIREDFDKLEKLAALSGNNPVARYLEHELDRADVVVEPACNIVRLGSRVRFHDLAKSELTDITLVMPDAADVKKGLISVLTPVGAALIGLAEGSRITYATPWGRERTLKVVKVNAALT